MNDLHIESRLNHMPVTRLHVAALVLFGLGLSMDLYELSLGVILSAVFSAPQHALSALELSTLLTSVYVGALIGAPLAGWMADRYGRRNVMSGLLGLVAIASLLSALSQTATQLAITRALAGLALGGYPAVMLAYLTDVLPPRRRGLLIMVLAALASAVPAAGILFVGSLGDVQPLGLPSWRWGFVVGGGASLVVALMLLSLPKSPRWLVSRHLDAEAEANLRRLEHSHVTVRAAPDRGHRGDRAVVEARHVPASPRLWRTIVALYLLSPWATVAFPVLAGAVLTRLGFSLTDTLLYVGLARMGPPVGLLALAFVIDWVDRRTAAILCAVVMVISGFGFVSARHPTSLVFCGAVFNIAAGVYAATLNLYTSESFATAIRAKAVGTAWALNRLGAAVAPVPLVALMQSKGPLAMFCVIAGTLVASMLLLSDAPVGRQQQPVD